MDILLRMAVKTIVTILLFVSISCTETKENNSINGIWTQQGYGRIIEITDSTYTYYNTTENSCIPLAKGEFEERWKIVKSYKNKLILNPGGIVDYRFIRTETLPKICKQANDKIDNSYEVNFEIFWNTFDNHYAFFEKRNLDWRKVKKKFLPLVKKIKSDKEFYGLLKEIVETFNDGHIKLDVPKTLKAKQAKKQSLQTTQNSKEDVKSDIIEKYVDNVQAYNSGVIQFGFLKNTEIGYILVSDMNDFADYSISRNLSEKEVQNQYDKIKKTKSPIEQFSDELDGVNYIMDKTLNYFKNSKAIIIDLRFNGGGYETVALKLLSYFVNEPKHILSTKAKMGDKFTKKQDYILMPNDRNYKNKVFLLTSNQTSSAAEIFALGALTYPRIESYGSSTNGIFSEILWKNLPNGWEFSLSNEVYSGSNGKEYEIIGVPVNKRMDYPKDPTAFYASFYKGSRFKDMTIEKIMSAE